MKPSLEGWPTKAKETPSPDEIRLAPLDTKLVFQCLRDESKVAFSAVFKGETLAVFLLVRCEIKYYHTRHTV